ncbi:conjugal transfer protein TraF [Veronia pacifica]|uniref:Conjugal transfer protein TraF n=1 Tax=Veronia pacifica TaxID=1080227 RepID=A0A1C3ECC0_9GAMM|nr:conjugal transfer protein TraF [Veronia pacifica]ODA30883.1 hypothetical protein A8L45_18905 [Veronia pacifica]
MKKTHIALAVSLGIFSLPSSALVGGDARSAGMGGTGVASANYLTAPFYNPALMAQSNDSNDFGLLLPSVSAGVKGTENLQDKIDDFQGANKALENLNLNNPDPEVTKRVVENWKTSLKALDNSGLDAGVGVGFAVAVPNSLIAVNVFSKTDVDSMLRLNIDGKQLDQPLPDADKDESRAVVAAMMVTDVGVSLARNIDVPYINQTISFGFSPKIQKISAYQLNERLASFDNGNFELPTQTTDTTAFNLDLGVSYQPVPEVTAAFSATNLIAQELESPKSNGQTTVVQIEPRLAAGVAYDNGWFLGAVDVDLTEQNSFKTEADGKQYARLGAELNAWGWAQVRAGYAISMTDGYEDLASIGLGFSPFGTLGFDLAAQVADQNEIGVAAEFSLTF